MASIAELILGPAEDTSGFSEQGQPILTDVRWGRSWSKRSLRAEVYALAAALEGLLRSVILPPTMVRRDEDIEERIKADVLVVSENPGELVVAALAAAVLGTSLEIICASKLIDGTVGDVPASSVVLVGRSIVESSHSGAASSLYGRLVRAAQSRSLTIRSIPELLSQGGEEAGPSPISSSHFLQRSVSIPDHQPLFVSRSGGAAQDGRPQQRYITTHTHGTVASAIRQGLEVFSPIFHQHVALPGERPSVLTTFLPTNIAMLVSSILVPLALGANVHLLPQLGGSVASSQASSITELVQLCESTKVHWKWITAAEALALTKDTEVSHSLQGLQGGSVVIYPPILGPKVLGLLGARLGGSEILQAFTIETSSGLVSFQSESSGAQPCSSAGRALPATLLSTLGEDGRPTPHGESGLLQIAGPQLASSVSFLPGTIDTAGGISQIPPGYAVTDDHALLDEYGRLFILDAPADHVQGKGAAILPSQLEDEVTAHPYVYDCAIVIARGGSVSKNFPSLFVRLDSPTWDRMRKGGPREEKKIRAELERWIGDKCGNGFKTLKGLVKFTDVIERDQVGRINRERLRDRLILVADPSDGQVSASSKPKMGYFPTVTSAAATTSATPSGSGSRRIASKPPKASSIKQTPVPVSAPAAPAPGRKGTRDSKRRATHSQIERRRREKINDRLVTLRNLVPACSKEYEDRKRGVTGANDEEGGDANEGGKRKRQRRKIPETTKDTVGEEELGLHKLEVLTHAIDYIYLLKSKIAALEGKAGLSGHRAATSSPASQRLLKEEKEEDESMCGTSDLALSEDEPLALVSADGSAAAISGRGTARATAAAVRRQQNIRPGAAGHDPVLYRRVTAQSFPLAPSPPLKGSSSGASSNPRPYRGMSGAMRMSSASSSSEALSPHTFSPWTSESPMLTGSSSSLTSIASPLMSLSAGSPILFGANGSAAGISVTGTGDPGWTRRTSTFGMASPLWQPLPAAVLPLSTSEGKQGSARQDSLGKLTAGVIASPAGVLSGLHQHPPPASPPQPRSTNSSLVSSPAQEPSPKSSTNEDGLRVHSDERDRASSSADTVKGRLNRISPDDATAAELLLNFSSPEALRPLSDVRQIPFVKQRKSRGAAFSPAEGSPAAARGDATPDSPKQLVSPPHLALDEKASSGGSSSS